MARKFGCPLNRSVSFAKRFLERLEGDQICTREHCPDTLSKLSHVGTHVQHCLDAAVCEPMILGLVLRAKAATISSKKSGDIVSSLVAIYTYSPRASWMQS